MTIIHSEQKQQREDNENIWLVNRIKYDQNNFFVF